MYTLLRDDRLSKTKGWIRGNTKIGPALEVAASHHQGYGIEIMINSMFGDGTCSWLMIVNGTNKYVTEMTEETKEDDIDYIGDSTWKLGAKARPNQTSMSTSSCQRVKIPYLMRLWIDVEPGEYDKGCFEVSKKIIRLLRNDPSVLREDGGVEFRILAPMSRSEFTSSQHWSIRAWLNYLQKRRSQGEISVLCGSIYLLIPFCTFEQFEAT